MDPVCRNIRFHSIGVHIRTDNAALATGRRKNVKEHKPEIKELEAPELAESQSRRKSYTNK